ncbi:Cullin family Cullin protein neddylation domain [Trypanosoma vivax]|uniref:Putative cullin n=1 Tax=Trypanosoma vivax (strain Y486) TaxID=1055687 RepID=G0U1I5_TRYVY|nr:putative cullin [Trypanosoma vivax]KAH8617050.1 Cullin family Cullin protein neddylation domain [Trypanosoma vivax]CCC49942.1 putative cullin [Trypanosoma vivax Y486]
MLKEDREAIRKMKSDFEAIAELTESEFKSKIGFAKRMNHYSTVYNAATRTNSADHASDPIGYYADEVLYMDFQEMLSGYLMKYYELKASTEVELFSKVLKVWEHYKILMKWNINAFAYLSRYYIVNFSKPSLRQVALSIFIEQVLKKHAHVIIRVAQNLVLAERRGEIINREHVREAVEMLSSMTGEEKQEIYYEQFLKPYIAAAVNYYVDFVKLSESDEHSKFLRKIEQAYEEESSRSAFLFSAEDKLTILSKVEEALIDSPVVIDRLLKSSNGFNAALRCRNLALIKTYFNLFSRRPKALECLSNVAKDEIALEGDEKLRRYACGGGSVDFKSCVSDIMKLQEEFIHILNECFRGQIVMLSAVREGLEKVYSGVVQTKASGGCVPLSELLAYYADAVIKCSGKLAYEEELDRVIAALSFVTDRDTFLAHSRDLLAQRILFPRKQFDDATERSFAQRISQLCGVSNTSFLEGMLHDLDVAEGFRASERIEVMGRKPPFALKVLALKKGIWPPRIQGEDFKPPHTIQDALHAFEQVYLSGTVGRVLSWSYSCSSAEVMAHFPKGAKMLTLTGLQCWVLLVFNEEEYAPASKIMQRYGVSLDALKPALHALLKCAILLRDMDTPLSPDDIYAVNNNFTSKWKRVKVSAMTDRSTDEFRSEEVAKEVVEDRKPAIDACLIRIMKSRRVVEHAVLVEECQRKLSRVFNAYGKLIKERIGELIKKEFIERDSRSSGAYVYIA